MTVTYGRITPLVSFQNVLANRVPFLKTGQLGVIEHIPLCLMRVNWWPLRGHGSGAYPGWRHQHCASQNTPCSRHYARKSLSPDSMVAAVVPLQRERAGEAVPAARGLSDRYPARRCGDLDPEPSRSVGREARTACRYSSPAEFFAPAPS